jgi:putative transposase
VRYGERLAEIGAVPSIGTVDDSYDNALAGTVSGYYKAELIRGPARPRLWRTIDVELATLAGCTGTTPADCTATSATSRPPTLPSRATGPRSKSNSQSLHQTQGGSLLVRHATGTQSCARSRPARRPRPCPRRTG